MNSINCYLILLAVAASCLGGCASPNLTSSETLTETIPESLATSAVATPESETAMTEEAADAMAKAMGLDLEQHSFGDMPEIDNATIGQVSYQQEVDPAAEVQVASQPKSPQGFEQGFGGGDQVGSGFSDSRGQPGFGGQGRHQPGNFGFPGQRQHGRFPQPGAPPMNVNANLFIPGYGASVAGQGFSQATVVQHAVPNQMPLQQPMGGVEMEQPPAPSMPFPDTRGPGVQVEIPNYNGYAPGAVNLRGDQLRHPQVTANEVSLQLRQINGQLQSEIYELKEKLNALQEKYDAEHQLRLETDQKLSDANQLNAELKRMAAQLSAQNERLAREKADIKRRADDALRQIETKLDSAIMSSISKTIKNN